MARNALELASLAHTASHSRFEHTSSPRVYACMAVAVEGESLQTNKLPRQALVSILASAQADEPPIIAALMPEALCPRDAQHSVRRIASG